MSSFKHLCSIHPAEHLPFQYSLFCKFFWAVHEEDVTGSTELQYISYITPMHVCTYFAIEECDLISLSRKPIKDNSMIALILESS